MHGLAAAAVFLTRSSDSANGATADRSGFVAPYAAPAARSGVIHEIELTASASTTELTTGQQTGVWSFNGSVPGPALELEGSLVDQHAHTIDRGGTRSRCRFEPFPVRQRHALGHGHGGGSHRESAKASES